MIFHKSNFFGSSHFLIHEILKNWPKMTQAKKVKILKNQFFMPVNYTKECLKSVHTVSFFLWLFSETLNFYFKIMGPLFKIFFCSNHYIWLVLWVVRCGRKSDNLRATLVVIYWDKIWGTGHKLTSLRNSGNFILSIFMHRGQRYDSAKFPSCCLNTL